MLRYQRAKLIVHPPYPRPRKLLSKELDLLLLAGCSCLLTVLYHPVAEALQSAHTANSNQGAIAAQTSKTPSNSTAPMYLSIPPKREEIKEDEKA